MGAPSFPDQGPPRAARTISSRFAARVAVPVVFLVLLWGAAAGAALAGALHGLPGFRSVSPGHRALVESSAVIGAGLVVVLVAVLLTGGFIRRVAREIAGLAAAANQAAVDQAAGVQLGTARWPAATTAEVAATAVALLSMQRAAIAATTAEAGVRNGLRQILGSLGKRNQSLLARQLRIIDTLEQQAESPAALAELFSLDHLTTRMRRHAESLSIMSGAAPARAWSEPVPVIDVLRAAVSEIEDYKRVTVLTDTEEAVAAAAVTDLIHLLAELIENATLFSPSTTRVEVTAERVANGFAIEVEDRGLGIAPDQLKLINEQLASPPDFDMADADRLGLFVTGRLAARHDIQVSLTPSPYRGIKAVVLLPDSLVMAPADRDAADPAHGGSAAPGLRLSEALSLVGAVHARSLATAGAAGAAGASGASGASGVPDPVNTAARADAEDTADEWPRVAGGDRFDADSFGTFHGLPRRVRPGNSPQVHGTADPGAQPAARTRGPAGGHVPPEAPAPEHARNLVSSLQDSWQRSREADAVPDTELADSGPSVGWLDDTVHDAAPGGGTAREDEEM
jgi:signal transduction histidine kinase